MVFLFSSWDMRFDPAMILFLCYCYSIDQWQMAAAKVCDLRARAGRAGWQGALAGVRPRRSTNK
jgi:hypothetical protein